MQGSEPLFDKDYIHIKKGRHPFIFLFYRQAVTSVSHCDKIVSQHIARVVNRSRKLFAYSVVVAMKEQEEIEKILASLSALTAPYAEDIQRDVLLLAELDFIFAKGSRIRSLALLIVRRIRLSSELASSAISSGLRMQRVISRRKSGFLFTFIFFINFTKHHKYSV